MYIYIHIYIHIYMCICIYVYVYVYINTDRKCLIYHEAIGGLVITGLAHHLYINICIY